MTPWTQAAIVIGLAITITAAITGWLALWNNLNIDRDWPLWICVIAGFAPIIIGLYLLVVLRITA